MNILVIGGCSIAQRHARLSKQLFPAATIFCASDINSLWMAHYVDHFVEYLDICNLMDIDLGFICSPSPFHLNHLQTLGSLNIPYVLVEKPILPATTKSNSSFYADFSNIISESQSNVLVGYQYRFDKSFLILKELLSAGNILWNGASFVSSRHLDTWRPNSLLKDTVTYSSILGGGILNELAHEPDIILGLLGQPDLLFASNNSENIFESSELLESLSVTFKYNSHSPRTRRHVNLNYDFVQRTNVRELSVFTNNGTYIWNLIDSTLYYSDRTYKVLVDSSSVDYDYPYIQQLQYLLSTNKASNDLLCQSINTQFTLDAIYTSIIRQLHVKPFTI